MIGFEHMLAEAAPWLHRYGFAALALAVMLEGVGIPLPGAILMGIGAASQQNDAFDLNRALGMVMGLLLYTTPIIYSDTIQNPVVQTMIAWNPLTYLVCSARDIIIYGRLYEPTGFTICAGVSLVLFLISWRLFYVSEHQLIEKMI